MKNEIKFQNENHHSEGKKDWTDLEWINEFYKFLQGECPENINLVRGHQPILSQKKAFAIIWYLQEHLSVFPDHIEQCSNCGQLYDTYSEGIYWQSKGKHFCYACEYLVPENYDRGKK